MKLRLTAPVVLLALAACHAPPPPEPLTPLPGDVSGDRGVASPRVSGGLAADLASTPQPQVALGSNAEAAAGRKPAAPGPGDVVLNFVDTDIREIAKSILGGTLKVNYTIDPAVRGTATIETAQPVARDQLLGILETLLAQNGATLNEQNGLYRVLPANGPGANAGLLGADGFGSGTQFVPLRYASAKDLAKVLEPFVSEGGKVSADPNHNALVVSGDPTARESLVGLIRAFDIDLLAGQSYAVFPVSTGDPAKAAGELSKAFGSEQDGPTSGLVKVIPMERVNAVLVVASQGRYIDDARRLFGLIDRAKKATARNWHVYYVQNGDSRDLENLLQRAFTPGHVSSTSGGTGSTTPSLDQISLNQGSSTGGYGGAGTTGGFGTSGTTGGLPGATGGLPGSSGSTGTGGSQSQFGAGTPQDNNAPAQEALSTPSGEKEGDENRMRIIANRRNNALLIYATPEEQSVMESMLRKIDILPLQVRIDATIAEVTLNDQLQYGTQFFFKDGGLQSVLSTGTSSTINGAFPGFVLAKTSSVVHATLSALQAVTTVRVLSSPQVMVLDNEKATLQVGDDVPILTQSATSQVTSTPQTVNSISYVNTGVILQVIPRVNTGGLVTLDISQEVSTPSNTTTSTIGSPTISERKVTSRVVIQDGQTVGLAGLIRDDTSEGNSGIPWLKDIPILGSLLSTQDNNRQRTELLVLITPHVIHDQRDARALTDDLRANLSHAGLVPQELNSLPLSGSPNPNAALTK
ncbi:type II secretion system protein GspD [Aliidongia dinghuensis]|uniref:Type II secretion system protein GspD n=1 Tax=Aliidongia dinghuensis TaxID=1867774 RepID=A0A8J3E4F0_9PROT|nr:type II secretion system secretin GspD [Aliidongia dinghuensis]GGF23595.1 type II secretion system protein GspD [Aliidongia dinghuensis]